MMVSESFEIIISEKGSNVVKRRLEDIGKSAKTAEDALKGFQNDLKNIGGGRQLGALERELGNVESGTRRAARGFGDLRTAIAALGLGVLIRQLTQVADSYTNIQNRLRLVTNGTQNLAGATRGLFEIAQETRSEFASTAQFYGRVAQFADQLALSQQNVAEITRETNQAIILSGVSGQEAANGIRQFTQALGSGRLQGDELRSIGENFPRLARAIADGLGAGVAQLRKLGAEGELTAQRVLDALRGQAPLIAAEFELLAPTISQAFTTLSNSFQIFIGTLDQSTGASASFARGIILLSEVLVPTANGMKLMGENVDLLKKAIVDTTIVVGALVVALNFSAIAGAFSSAMAAMGTALAAFRTAITAANAAVVLFEATLLSLNVALGVVATVGFVLFANSAIDNMQKARQEVLDSTGGMISDLDILGAKLAGLQAGFKAFFDSVRNFRDGQSNLGVGIQNIAISLRNGDLQGAFNAASGLSDAAISDSLQPFTNAGRAAAAAEQQALLAAGSRNARGFNTTAGLGRGGSSIASRGAGGSRGRAGGRQVDRAAELRDVLQALEDEASVLQKASFEREEYQKLLRIENRLRDQGIVLSEREREGIRFAINRNESLDRRASILDKIAEPLLTYQRGLADINALEAEGKLSGEALNQAVRDLNNAYDDNEPLRKRAKILKESQDALQRNLDILRLDPSQQEAAALLLDRVDALKELKPLTDEELKQQGKQIQNTLNQTRAQERLNQVITDFRTPLQNYVQDTVALNAALEKGAISQQFFNRELREVEASFLATQDGPLAGIRAGLTSVSSQAFDLANNIKTGIEGAFTSMEDAMVQFVATGKITFRDLTTSIISDLARIAVRRAITQPLADGLGSAFGSALGGGVANISGLSAQAINPQAFGLQGPTVPGFATGGSFMVGGAGTTDSRLVSFRATPGERVTVSPPGESQRGTQGGNVYVNVNNAPAGTNVQQRRQPNGDLSIDVFVGEMLDRVAGAVEDPTSRIGRAFQGTYGATPAFGGLS